MFRKYMNTEKTEVLNPKQHEVIENELHKVGATSVKELNSQQKEEVTQRISQA